MQATMDQMSIWILISHASLLVKLVMLILVLASFYSWYLIIRHSLLLHRQEQLWKGFVHHFRQQKDLYVLQQDFQQPEQQQGVIGIFQHGFDEYQQLKVDKQLQATDVIDGVERRLLSKISEEEEKLQQNLTFLATVGSVSPYIGLFGTVWGIMNAFIGLSTVEQATLNTVAPGIAEALIATAIGLFAAIPAVIAYNRFSARAEKLSGRYYGFANELQTRIYRLLGRNTN
ncbi:protein TolQ [Acinetobacter sp. 226-4]|uniref:protein TolQ n=1 Tax=Acinetobacter sp. 226-4 TaxID=2746719 RepID=UPI0025775563|nr:protein TolQ [Acinetobacter sp. 226-4]MDM1768100.1 protein TolQ [Acinetobacter sp. 226-4]